MDVKLVMFKPSGQRKDFPITSPITVIGRSQDSDLRVPILSVSRHHCEVAVAGDSVTAKDLGSSNGTYVNNSRINEVQLSAGDRLAVGPIVFTVQIDGQPEQVTPVKTRGQKMAEAGEPGAEEIVDLEADIVAQPGASEELPAAILEPAGEEEIDPISALEALAAEDKEEDKDKGEQ
jgi:pSer/pThr/pTyr-binding forkhead associated (FHA) protein